MILYDVVVSLMPTKRGTSCGELPKILINHTLWANDTIAATVRALWEATKKEGKATDVTEVDRLEVAVRPFRGTSCTTDFCREEDEPEDE